MKKRSRRLVIQHLEGIAGAVLDEFPKTIREFIRGRNGVYALYKKDRLYYVGLARNLRSRLRGHMSDRHAGRWDRFSIYLTEGDEHLKELESLVLRIAEPRGNRVTGKFIASEDLSRRFQRQLKEDWRSKFREMTGRTKPEPQPKAAVRKRRAKVSSDKPRSALARYVSKRFHIRLRHKGKLYVAQVQRDGSITFTAKDRAPAALHGKRFLSPSNAAKAVTGSARNGWAVWHFWSTKDELVPLDMLRKGKAKPRF